MYSYIKDDGGGDKKAKGVRKDVVKRDITQSDYLRVLEEERVQYSDRKAKRSCKHEIGSYAIHKVSLSCYDNKRFILSDGFNTKAHGHYKNKLNQDTLTEE